jgi:hypothetical protein
MKTKAEFTVLRGNFSITGTLRECQQTFIEYRNANNLGASDLLQFDGLVYRDSHACGHFSYNGRFWRTNIKGLRLRGRA